MSPGRLLVRAGGTCWSSRTTSPCMPMCNATSPVQTAPRRDPRQVRDHGAGTWLHHERPQHDRPAAHRIELLDPPQAAFLAKVVNSLAEADHGSVTTLPTPWCISRNLFTPILYDIADVHLLREYVSMTHETNFEQKVRRWWNENTKDTDLSGLLSELEQRELELFNLEYTNAKKSKVIAILLAFFLGGIGAHHIYLKKYVWVLVYIALCWTFIPSVASLIEIIFLLSQRIDEYNVTVAKEIVLKNRHYVGKLV